MQDMKGNLYRGLTPYGCLQVTNIHISCLFITETSMLTNIISITHLVYLLLSNTLIRYNWGKICVVGLQMTQNIHVKDYNSHLHAK